MFWFRGIVFVNIRRFRRRTNNKNNSDLCSINPQSPNSCFPLAEMHAKDTHENLSKAKIKLLPLPIKMGIKKWLL